MKKQKKSMLFPGVHLSKRMFMLPCLLLHYTYIQRFSKTMMKDTVYTFNFNVEEFKIEKKVQIITYLI